MDGGLSLSVIVTVVVDCDPNDALSGFDKVIVKVSFSSSILSTKVDNVNVLLTSPAEIVKVPAVTV